MTGTHRRQRGPKTNQREEKGTEWETNGKIERRWKKQQRKERKRCQERKREGHNERD